MLTAGGRERVAAGATIIREGEPVEAVYIVLEGALSVTNRANTGQEVARLHAGEIIGEISFVDGRPTSATVSAVQDCLLFRLQRALLSDRLDHDTAFAARFYRALAVFLAGRLRDTTNRLGYGTGQSLEEDSEYEGELDFAVLDSVHLAGARFERMVKRLAGGG